MKILFLTSGRIAPATRFRVLPYLPYLRRAGHHCVVRHSHPPKYEHYPWLGWRLSQRARRAVRQLNLGEAWLRRFDVVYVERELFDDDSAALEERFRRIAPALVLDVDDAVFLRHPDKYAALARMADTVIAGNAALADYTRPLNPRVTVAPTSVDLDRYQPAAPRVIVPGSPIVIGWTGTSSNLHHLQLVAGPLRQLAERHSLELRVIADDPAPRERIDFGPLPVRFRRWSPQSEIADLAACHIGIMPLADAQWERYKCGLKLIQYLALALPAVASPVGVNSTIVAHGENGLLATSEEEWYDALDRLITDCALREQLGRAGRTTVEGGYSVQANYPKLLEALSAARGGRP
jgi:glycosyltransferase involved in cell wall biosynthesis